MKQPIRRRLVAFLVIGALSFTLVSYNNTDDRYFQIVKNLDIFATLFKEVNNYYVDEVNPNTLIRTGIDAMLVSLDPYTNYIGEDEIEDYRTMTTGRYGGIGALVGKRNGRSIVLMPYEGFPAHDAGLAIGDEILAIDGYQVEGKTSSEISRLLKGQQNTALRLTIKRYGQEAPIDISLKRARVQIKNVPHFGMVADGVGYIKLTDFTGQASREVKNAMQDLKDQGATRLVLDLRGNPGGLLTEAVNISNLFIPKGSPVVSTKGKVEEWNKTYKALDMPLDTEMPVAVLINGSSASASEIVAGVIQDYDRGVLIGQNSYGKGLVQTTRPLTYNSQLKVTTAKYYTPSGRCIQAIDYSHRDADGSAVKVADSLITAFNTSNGRVVYDGKGVAPDIPIELEFVAPITTALVSKGLLFDYATAYYYTKPAVTDLEAFSLSDADYAEFVAWLKTQDFSYTTSIEKEIDALVETAKEEKYYEDIASQLNTLREQVASNKEQDLQKFRKEIAGLLEVEIASRYFLQQGQTEASFKYDQELTEAIAVLNDDARMKQILNVQ